MSVFKQFVSNAHGDAAIVDTGSYGTGYPKIIFDDAWTATNTPMDVLLALYKCREKLIQHLSTLSS